MSKPIYRASGIYECPRHLSAIRLGIAGDPDPPWLETAAQEGHLHEKIIKGQLRDEGLEVSRDQEEFTLRSTTNAVVGHIDGWVKDVGWEGLLEIKSMSQFEFQRYTKEGWDGFTSYANQITLYWHMTKAEQCLYIVKNRSSGYVKREMLTKPPRNLEDILAHIDRVEQWCLEHNTPMDAEYDPKSIECKRCPYAKVLGCIKEVEAKPADEKALEDARKLWWKGKRMEEEGKVFQVDAKEVFTAHAMANGLEDRTWVLKDIGVLYHHVKGSVTYPKAKLLSIFSELELRPAMNVGESRMETKVTPVKGKGKEENGE